MVIIGRVLGAHGVRGEIRILPLTDFPERFLGMDRIDIFRPGGDLITSLEVENVRPHEGKGLFLVQALEVRDREAAQALEGGLVMVPGSERVSLPEDYLLDRGYPGFEGGPERDRRRTRDCSGYPEDRKPRTFILSGPRKETSGCFLPSKKLS